MNTNVGALNRIPESLAQLRGSFVRNWIRPKQNISPLGLIVLATVAVIPMFMIYARVLAMPSVDGMPWFGFEFIAHFGELLNQWISLVWVPPHDRPLILYLLMLPTGALFIVVARLTFGLRILGIRAILIAIGFQQAGFIPSLVLLAIVIGIIVAIRPSMRRVKLPLYARVSIVLCFAALIMIIALLVAPWVRSEAVWAVAFFPVIIVAMMAEGVAKTVANDHTVMAVWRAGWTIIIAVLIALFGQSAALGAFIIQFPELLVTQMVMIVFIAEFFDLRLLEAWPDRIHRRLQGMQFWYSDQPKVAVVRNRNNNGVMARISKQAPSRYRRKSVQKLVNGLRDVGYRVKVIEGDMNLLRALTEFMPNEPGSLLPGGIVLNLATGIQGVGRFGHVAAMLEAAGVPYTGPDPVCHARVCDKFALYSALEEFNLRVPRYRIISRMQRDVEYKFPLEVSPRLEPDARSVVVRDLAELQQAVARIRRKYSQDAIAHSVVRGRDIRVGLIGNDHLECLPPLEYLQKRKICPAELDESLADAVNAAAKRAFIAAGCRDYARIDLRITSRGRVVVMRVMNADIMARRGSFVSAAQAAGYSLSTLVARIVQVAAMRYELPAVSPGRDEGFTGATVASILSLQRARQAKLGYDQ